jgi:transposase InsO family protein
LSDDERPRSHERWAHLRFGVVGGLLASPPAPGELRAELARLAEKAWRHPTTGELVRFGQSTIERWYYAARAGSNPVGVLRRKLREDSGRFLAITDKLAQALRRQYKEHPSWSYKLHLDNLAVGIERDPDLGAPPSYPTVRRFMAAQGLLRQRRRRGRQEREGEIRAREHLAGREVRSFESEYVSGLWHLDFHHGSLKVLRPQGEWVTPIMLAILDDRSRLVCHAQWYLDETAESLVHGLAQAFLKRGLPRALLSDNGSAMIAHETTQGLARLSVTHRTTLPYSPYQNGKQETFWNPVEGRLLAMLEGQPDLTLGLLNEATQAWVEMEYNREVHSEISQAPLARWLDGPTVGRDCPTVDDLRLAFTAGETRSQRRSDGTASIEGVRFEIPARFRHLRKLHLRYASWDLTHVWLVDERTDAVLSRLYPLDKARNADGFRGVVELAVPGPLAQPAGIAPLLRKLMTEYAATGLPPAYIPKEEK